MNRTDTGLVCFGFFYFCIIFAVNFTLINHQHYFTVISNFNGALSVLHHLNLTVGEKVIILKQTSMWFYGRRVDNKSELGIFPKNYISIKSNPADKRYFALETLCLLHHLNALFIHYFFFISKSNPREAINTRESPIVEEVASLLREWKPIWKQLYLVKDTIIYFGKHIHVVNLINISFILFLFFSFHFKERNKNFETIRMMMYELIDMRIKILSGTLPGDEFKVLKKEITSKIDYGNAYVELFLVNTHLLLIRKHNF
jgi:dedicator of cytokinesis protein 1